MVGLLIGEVAAKSGLSAPTIRYYESLGLVRPVRSMTGYRRYSDATLEELRFIKKAQALGFSLEEVREILKLGRSGSVPCADVIALARRHLREVDERIQQLQKFREHLAVELAKWDGKRAPTCRELCQIIATAAQDDTMADVNLRLNRPTRFTRGAKP